MTYQDDSHPSSLPPCFGPFSKTFISVCYVPDTGLGTRVKVITRTDQVAMFMELMSHCGGEKIHTYLNDSDASSEGNRESHQT